MILLPVLALLSPPPQEADTFAVSALVSRLAFDPARFFDPPFGDVVRIRYRGDDYAWPVFAIAVNRACARTAQAGPCTMRTMARMVRGTTPDGKPPERERWRGLALASKLAKKGLDTPAEVVSALEDGAVEWLEADLDHCPGATQALVGAGEVSWIRPGRLDAKDNGAPEIVLHADTIRVEFVEYLRNATYDGYIAEGTPAAWANAFAQKLAPCWQPSAAPRPWSKPLPKQ